MKKEKDQEDFDKRFVTIFMLFVVIFGLIFCFLVYTNQIKGSKLKVEDYEQTESTDKANITNVLQEEKYVKIEGEFYGEIKSYEIYIGMEGKDGKMRKYQTELQDENSFYALLESQNLNEGTNIYIVYQCDDQKILIKTDKVLGE